ncbi:MAG: hypothetical protein ACTSQE_01475 [Candidatus Heimdallarchaeaceae archaeon]
MKNKKVILNRLNRNLRGFRSNKITSLFIIILISSTTIITANIWGNNLARTQDTNRFDSNNTSKQNTIIQNRHYDEYELFYNISLFILRSLGNKGIHAKIVFSECITIESSEYLIIIGHGYFKEANYYIGDLSNNLIQSMSANKKFIALLACYSSTVFSKSEGRLVYNDKVKLNTAFDDLLKFLQISNLPTFSVKAIELYELDAGDGVSGSSESQITYFDQAYAYTTYDGNQYYWNLQNTYSGHMLHLFLYHHKYYDVTMVGNGYFTIHTEKEYFFGLIKCSEETTEYHKITCKVFTASNGYLIAHEYKIDGEDDPNKTQIKLATDDDETKDQITQLEFWVDFFYKLATFCLTAGLAFLVAGWKTLVSMTLFGIAIDTVFVVLGVVLIIVGIIALIVWVVLSIIYSKKLD